MSEHRKEFATDPVRNTEPETLPPLRTVSPKLNRPVMPPMPAEAQAMRDMKPEDILDNMSIETATSIVSQWREYRQSLPPPKETTVSQYSGNAKTLLAKYERERDLDPGLLNPVDFVRSLIKHSGELAKSTWNTYRYSILYYLNKEALRQQDKGLSHPSYLRALAWLIVITKSPSHQGKTPEKKPYRAKSLPARKFQELITYLATNHSRRNRVALRAQSFAMATFATGLRPGEWLSVLTRPAETNEVPPGECPEKWLALVVRTSKRKSNEDDWYRTILIPPGTYQTHIRQHQTFLREAVARSSDAHRPDNTYIKRCSTMIHRACKQLWPNREEWHCTLYSLRSQARANVSREYGRYVGAAMLGHAPAKSSSYYAGARRANTKGFAKQSNLGDRPVPVPGKDVLEKAMAFEAREAIRPSSQPSERCEPDVVVDEAMKP